MKATLVGDIKPGWKFKVEGVDGLFVMAERLSGDENMGVCINTGAVVYFVGDEHTTQSYRDFVK